MVAITEGSCTACMSVCVHEYEYVCVHVCVCVRKCMNVSEDEKGTYAEQKNNII